MVNFDMMLTFIGGFLSAWALAVPTAHTSRNEASVEFTSDFFRGALPAEELGIVGPVVVPTVQTANVTTGLETRDAPQREIRLTMANTPSHVGYTVAQSPGPKLRRLLEKYCGIRNRNDDLEAAPPANARVPGLMCSRSDILVINNIFANGDINAYLRVKVESDFIPETHNPDGMFMLKHFIDQIVQAFEASIACDKNRYVRNDLQGCYEYANSAYWYQVGIHGMDNGVFPHLRVRLTFNGKSDIGQFDCKGSLTNVWSTLPESRVKDYADMMVFPLRGAIACADSKGLVEGLPVGFCQWDQKQMFFCGVKRPQTCKF